MHHTFTIYALCQLAVASFLHETSGLRFFGLEMMKRRKENLEDFLTIMLGPRREDSVSSDANDARVLFDTIDESKHGGIDEAELRKYLRGKVSTTPMCN
jgi:hypothetical protein